VGCVALGDEARVSRGDCAVTVMTVKKEKAAG
jgi:hypothetical protein